MADIPGRRAPIDFPDSGLGVEQDDSGNPGLPASVGYPEPNVPTFLSPGNTRKTDLGSERN